MVDDITRRVDFSKWSTPHYTLFSSLMVGFFMWGVISSIAPLFYPSVNAVWFLVVPIVAQLAGDLGISALSDLKLGRRTTFFFTMGAYGTGSLLIFLASFSPSSLSLPLIVAGIVLADFGIEGEVPSSLSYAAETMPLKYRETMLVLLPNFDNVGAMFAAIVAYLTYNLSDSYIIELRLLGLMAIVLVGVALLLRRSTPESARWLMNAGKLGRAEEETRRLAMSSSLQERHVRRHTSLLTRLVFLITVGVSQYLTYGLMAYVIADYYFKGSTVDLVVLFANFGASLAGVVAASITRRLGSRKFSLIAFGGGLLTMVPILLLVTSLVPFTLPFFYSLLFANMFFSEFGWAVRTIFEPTLLPIRRRAFMIGVVRVAPMLSYALSVQYTSSLTEVEFVIFNMLLWSLGLAGSLLWWFRGYDVDMVSLEETSMDAMTEARGETRERRA